MDEHDRISDRLLAFILVGLALTALTFGLAMAQDGAGAVTDPEWVVIFRVYEKPPMPDYEGQPVPDVKEVPFELRLIVRAKSEGEAAIRAKGHIDKFIVASNADCIRFLEAQQKEKK